MPLALKDQLCSQAKLYMIADMVHAAYVPFKRDAFIQDTLKQFPSLELLQRIQCISSQLRTFLPNNYKEALQILVAALPPELDPTKTDDDFGDFIFMSFSTFVALYGCTTTQYQESLAALKEMTKRFSVEYALREFLKEFPQQTMQELQTWVIDAHYHVRRAACEATRPNLPWAKKVNLAAADTIPLLDVLFFDQTRFVTRSIANHLNDVSKKDPELVLRTLRRWQKSGKQKMPEMEWLTKHALRTLIKQGHSRALAYLGFSQNPAITISPLVLRTKKIKIGESLDFAFKIFAQKQVNLVIDYSIDFVQKNGKTSSKVFKISTIKLQDNEQKLYTKKHPLRIMTTKKLYPGVHTLHIQINGNIVASSDFILQA